MRMEYRVLSRMQMSSRARREASCKEAVEEQDLFPPPPAVGRLAKEGSGGGGIKAAPKVSAPKSPQNPAPSLLLILILPGAWLEFPLSMKVVFLEMGGRTSKILMGAN